MNEEILDLATAKRYVDEAIDEMGEDFVYNPNRELSCYYAPLPQMDAMLGREVPRRHYSVDPREQTGCLAGRVMDAWGVTNYHRTPNAANLTIAGVIQQAGLENRVSPEVILFLEEIQTRQDSGDSWGVARTMATAAVEAAADQT